MIVITALEKNIDSPIDLRFGRAKYFVFYNTSSKQHHIVANESADIVGGAGVKAAQYLYDKKVKALLTGQVGPKARKVLKQAGIEIYTFEDGSVANVIKSYQSFDSEKRGSC